MGASVTKQLVAILDEEGGPEDFQKVFRALDENHDGSLSHEEWHHASRAFHDAIRGKAIENVRNEVRDAFSEQAPFMKKTMGKIAGHSVDVVAPSVMQKDGAGDEMHWVEKMFLVADTNKDGQVSLAEFEAWLRGAALEERKKLEQGLRDALADNMEENAGAIHVSSRSGGASSSVDVNIPGVTPERIRHGYENV